MTRKSTRRDFLRGKLAADNVADAMEVARSPGGEDRAAAESYVVRVSREAMACEFEVRLNAGQFDRGTEAALEALDTVDALENQLSVFRQSSEISRINQSAAAETVEVSPSLFTLLETAFRWNDETGGAFDVTSAPLWHAWGFARREGTVPNERQLANALDCVGAGLVELDADSHTIRFRKPGVAINLGGVGKGYALDCCARKLLDAGINDFLIHGGNSSVLAHGCLGSVQDEPAKRSKRGWNVGIRHPLRPDRRLAEVRLCDRALATSGSWAQSFVHEGRRYGHILDPRTGRPAEGVLSATAIAPTAAMADALSTAFYVMGADASLDYCRQRPELAAVLACPVRHSGGIEIRTTGDCELNRISHFCQRTFDSEAGEGVG